MKKLLASDGALKIISVLIAIGIWVYIALVMNPAIEVRFVTCRFSLSAVKALIREGLRL